MPESEVLITCRSLLAIDASFIQTRRSRHRACLFNTRHWPLTARCILTFASKHPNYPLL